ncbi:TonB-dependent receptor domain-containing protein [Armatimonas sp.]|uniref:TonB-dependent receptor domain-containing protein n=1 Tax=Armatimonas sp. TaxID=1872638 RepID=UPI00374D3C2D
MLHRLQTRSGVLTTATVLSLLLPAAVAWADGQVKFKVVDSKTSAVLPGAVIVIKAGPTDLEDMQFKTASSGLVSTGDLTAGTREYTARALVNGIGYKEIKGKVVVIDDQTIEVEIKLESLGETVIDIFRKQIRLDIDDPGLYTFRDREHLQFFPNAVGNRQSLNKALRSIPGMVPNSLNRLHSRGEADTGTYYIDGFQLPSLLAGRASQFLTPEMIESLKVRTGNIGANLGGGSTVLETSLRPAISRGGSPLMPLFEYAFNTEDYGGNSQSFTVSRQLGATHPDSEGKLVPNPNSHAGFVLSYSRRESTNFLESPQPQRQLSNNTGKSDSLLGKFSYRLSRQMEASAFLGISGSRNGVANRQGLRTQFGRLGFGFGGNRPVTAFPQVNFLDGTNFNASQEILGNNVAQSDDNRFYAVQLTRIFSPLLRGNFSIGGAETRQDTKNKNALGFPLTTGAAFNPATLPADYSIEYNPTTGLNFTQSQVQADFSYGNERSKHNYKFGVLSQTLRGNEVYQFVPMSNAALNAALNINSYLANSLRFNSDNSSPSTFIRRTGGSSAFYVQDTYVPIERARLSVGARVENFEQNQRIRVVGTGTRPDISSKRTESAVSPRINLLYQFPNGILSSLTKGQLTVLRAGYNQIFTAPGIGQGAIGTNQTGATPLPVAAQTNNQLDLSIEQQLKAQSMRLSFYNKDIKNTHQWQQMIQGPQAGAYMMVNAGNAKISGVEALYEFKPRSLDPRPGSLEPVTLGLSGYLALTSSNAKRSATAATGAVPLDWDQKQTMNLGVGYQLMNGSLFSLAYYQGSGLASSVSTVGGSRSPISQLDLRIRTKSKLIANLHALEIGVENLTNSRNPLNFQQGALAGNSLGGTRFQQGRRFVVGLSGKF